MCRQKYSEDEVVAFLIQVAEALTHLNNHRVIHCDVKLENLVLCDGHIKLIDLSGSFIINSGRSFEYTKTYAPPGLLVKNQTNE
jgi:serine/threonine protein kinase